MNSTNPNTKQEHAAVVAGWKAQDVDVLDNSGLNRAGCRFYNAVHKSRMDGVAVELAELPDGNVVATVPGRGEDAAASILTQCGADAPADWWAEVVARFAGKSLGRVVKTREAAYDIGEIENRGAQFHEPVLERDGTVTHVSFYTIRYEPSQPFRVSARLSSPMSLTVSAEPLAKP